jgi:single-strand DNA-binding protein
MSNVNINRVVLTGNLTRDPELREIPSGTALCTLRVATNTRRKDANGVWVDRPHFFNVKVWGAQGEAAAQHLSKGRPVAIDGRLEWSEWETAEGSKRQGVEIVAETVQFLGTVNGNGNGASTENGASEAVPAGVGAEEDIEF